MELVKYKDFYVRKGLGVDKQMVNDCLKNYRAFDNLDGAVVMDWGMNIGGFGKMMINRNIKQYIGVEPHPENFEVSVKNLGDRSNATLINAAVVSDDMAPDTVELYLTKSKQNLCSGTTNLKSNGARSLRPIVVTVKAVKALELINQYQPTHLKVDIEGAEYSVFGELDWQIPTCVKQLAMEFHWADKVLAYDFFREKLVAQGFTPVYEEVNYVKGETEATIAGKTIKYRNVWGLDGVYKR